MADRSIKNRRKGKPVYLIVIIILLCMIAFSL